MSSSFKAPDSSDEVFALAQAFARNELDSGGQQRLYDLLCESGERGRQHARLAWQALAIDSDLRAHLGGQAICEAVRLRLDDQGGFLQAVWQRLGWSRPTLQPVAVPEVEQTWRRFFRWPLGVLLLAVLLLLWWLMSSSWSMAVVVGNDGMSRLNGRPLPIGAQLDVPMSDGVVVVGEGSRLQLRLRDEGEMTLIGPTQASFAAGRIAVANGRVESSSGNGALSLGLPDGQLTLDAQSAVTVQVRDGQSAFGVRRGTARFVDAQLMPHAVTAGQAWHQGVSAAWLGGLGASPVVGDSAPWLQAALATAPSWRLSLYWQPNGLDDEMIFYDPRLTAGEGGEPLAVLGTRSLYWAGREWQLSGPPLAARRIDLRRWAGRTTLRIDGIAEALIWNLDLPPQLAGDQIDVILWHSGPTVPEGHAQ